jgi:DNA transformation protein
MAFTPGYRDYVLEQLGRVAPVTSRAMFGGVGIYSGGLFFALIAADVLYLKVDDANRGDYVAAGMGPFNPFGDPAHVMHYYQLPPDLLEDPDALRPWVDKALAAARAARRGKKR